MTASDPTELRLQMEGFEGPLDLLLHLIQKHELDILDIPIAFITEEYLKYIDAMKDLDLGIAGEYLVMAATLLHIKSKMLLPKPELDEDDAAQDEGLDPREELVRRLLEYQRYRDVADALGSRELQGHHVFRRPSRASKHAAEAGPGELVAVDLFHLLDAFRNVVRDAKVEVLHEVTPEGMSLRDTINAIADKLQESPRVSLLDLVYLAGDEPTRSTIVVTFMAVLEMAKLRLVRLFQSRLTTTDLMIERAVIAPDELAQKLAGLGDL